MRFALKHFLAALVLVVAFAAPASTGPLDDANAAYLTGDYASAFRLFGPVANEGNADAQYALGFMYAHGQGVKLR